MQKHSQSKTNRRKQAYLRGILAEYACAAYLMMKGYSILKMRYRNHAGEIDIVAAKGETLVFTEVKARNDNETAIYSVTSTKQRTLSQAASGFIGTHTKYSQHGLRFDVMVVTSWARINHIKDAWRP